MATRSFSWEFNGGLACENPQALGASEEEALSMRQVYGDEFVVSEGRMGIEGQALVDLIENLYRENNLDWSAPVKVIIEIGERPAGFVTPKDG